MASCITIGSGPKSVTGRAFDIVGSPPLVLRRALLFILERELGKAGRALEGTAMARDFSRTVHW